MKLYNAISFRMLQDWECLINYFVNIEIRILDEKIRELVEDLRQ
ncbi:hypothetical protein [Aequorivita vitellina]|nr:hypothetical protein [Aequorivita vitellina]